MELYEWLLRVKSDFHIEEITPEAVFIIDLDSGFTSVTNDAENVVSYLYNRFGNRRFIYRDTMGRWDELAHDHGNFTGFLPYSS